MVRGSNSIIINTTVELKQLIDHCKITEGYGLLHDSFYLARDYLIHHKDDFIAMYMQLREGCSEKEATELYEKELKRWSRTQNELRDAAKKRREAEEAKILAKAEEIKRKKNEKEIGKLLIEKKRRNPNKAYDKNRIAEIDKRLKELGYKE
jgi:hypothetical protein